jgi:hypothetical protein
LFRNPEKEGPNSTRLLRQYLLARIGAVLAPLLWFLVIDKLLTDLGFKVISFAGDLVIIIREKVKSVLLTALNFPRKEV